jgi:DNA-binding MarR family transcriptional regulator
MDVLTERGALYTYLILETFRFHGRVLAAGDWLAGPVGLTSARWQVLGAVMLAGEALPVAAIARNMGLSRQAVQRVANDLAAGGFVRFAENPRHRRARLVVVTGEGEAAYARVMARHATWANDLAAGCDAAELETALKVMRDLRRRLEKAEGGTD